MGVQPGTLYLVATPIGNLSDITERALQTLRECDVIAAEDTRVTLRLLSRYGIKKPLISYYRHNEEKAGETVLAFLREGKSCALVSDAGTPLISDPGENLIARCAAEDLPVISVPGPAALITALTLSALPTARFTFEGFLPQNPKNRRRQLSSLKQEERTMIFYEAPHKLRKTLSDLSDVFGSERRIALARELTKIHEEILRCTIGEAVARYDREEPRGEFVLVVEGAPPESETTYTAEDATEVVCRRIREGESVKDAVRNTAKERNVSKNALYEAYLRLQTQSDG